VFHPLSFSPCRTSETLSTRFSGSFLLPIAHHAYPNLLHTNHLVCLKERRSILVECKVGRSPIGKEGRRDLLKLEEVTGSRVVLARRRARRLELVELRTGNLLSF